MKEICCLDKEKKVRKERRKYQERPRRNRFFWAGFTLVEILIVLTIIAILLVVLLFFLQRHLARSRDTKRKSDIKGLEAVFEDYYNDHHCYPAYSALQKCGAILESDNNPLQPYIKSIPCDPINNQPYLYFSLNNSYCKGYRLLARLEVEDDSDIEAIGCSYETGCNYLFGRDYNFGVQRGWIINGLCEYATEGVGCDLTRSNEWRLPNDEFNYQPVFCIPEEGLYYCHHVTYDQLVEKFFCPRSFKAEECNPNPGGNCYEGSPDACTAR